MSPSSSRRLFIAVLALLVGAFLLLTAVPGTFTTDENNYNLQAITLYRGELAVPGFEGNPFAFGIKYFAPMPMEQRVAPQPEPTKTGYGTPALHAVLALPFTGFGWWGLAALNVLAFLVACAVVHRYARDFSTRAQTPVLALLAFAVGNFAIEYAQATWPHMLSIALIALGAYCAALARRDDRFALAAVTGLILGTAVGVRYQNTVMLAAGLLAFLVAGKVRLTLAAALGALPPLAGISTLNYLRTESLNPFFRDANYTTPRLTADLPPWLEPFAVFWTKVVDYSTHPPILSPLHSSYLHKDDLTGAILVGRSVKKAWMQSAPWVAIVLVGLAAAWVAFLRRRGPRNEAHEAQATEIRSLGVFMLPMLAALCVAGYGRTDGGAFNQRYFLEMTPLAAVAFALLLERTRPLERLPALIGAGLACLALAGVLTSGAPGSLKLWFVMLAPLAIGGLALFAWLRNDRIPQLLSIAVGAALAWGFTLHLLDDLPASRHQRTFNALRKEAVAHAFVEPAAVFAWSYNKDALGPLQLEQDLLIVESGYDEVGRLELLARSLAAQGRNVYVLANDMPPAIVQALVRGVGGGAPRERTYPVAEGMQPLTVLELGSSGAQATR